MMPRIVAIGADHAGYELKDVLKRDLTDMGVEVLEFGANSSDPVDYPDVGQAVARTVADGKAGLGVLICRTGIGMTIAANRHHRVRAALCRSAEDAELARRHNDANVLALGGRTTTAAVARQCLKVFLTSDFDGGRHAKRVAKLS